MLEKNQVYEIQIVDMGHKGEAIGKVDGFTVFVDGAIKGDIVKGKVTKSKKSYAVADLVEVIKPSELRVDPICSLSGICGGCQIMHMDYNEQLKLKEGKIKEDLIRIGKIESPNMLPIIGMDEPYYYRNKAQFPVERTSQGDVNIGFYRKFSHSVVPFETCYIQNKVNDQILDAIKEYIEQSNIKIYDEKTQNGNLRKIMTKVGFETGEIMVVLVSKEKAIPKKQLLVDLLTKHVEGITTIVQNINSKNTNVILGSKNVVLYGSGKITDRIHNLVFEISPHSFFQVNPKQTDALYSKALEFAEIDKTKTVYDIYCGIGTISLFLAQKAKKVIGIEVVPEAIEDAKRNAELNNLTNTEFHCGKAEYILPELFKEGITADVVVLDPPRKGCEEAVLTTIAEIKPERIVYVSCNPSTLARDVQILEENGYKLEKAQGVDLFPHSMHVETVALLTRV